MRSTFKVLFYLKRNKDKDQKVVPVMGRITVNGSIAQFSAKLSVPEMLWEVSGGRAKGRSLEADRINRHLDNIRTQIGKHSIRISATGSHTLRPKRSRMPISASERNTGCFSKRSRNSPATSRNVSASTAATVHGTATINPSTICGLSCVRSIT